MDQTRILPLLIPVINATLRVFKIRKQFQRDLNYRLFSEAFENKLANDTASEKIIVTPFFSGGNNIFLMISAMIAKFLQPAGYKHIIFVCDKALPRCNNERIHKVRERDSNICKDCFGPYSVIAAKTKAEIHYVSSYLSREDSNYAEDVYRNLNSLHACLSYEYDGIPLGQLTKKSVLRFYYIGELTESEEHLKTYREFIRANILTLISWRNFVNSFSNKPDLILLYNGTLSFESVIRFFCKRNQMDYVTHETYVGTNSWIFKKNDEVMLLDWPEEWKRFEAQPFTPHMEKCARDFLNGLQYGKQMYAVLNESHRLDPRLKGVKYTVLFTNLNFDTAVLGRNPIFKSMLDWIEQVIRYWIQNNIEMILVVRVHPAELKLTSASSDFTGERIRNLVSGAANIIIYDADDQVNSYELIKNMDFGLIYSSTIGLEIAYHGKPLLVAGDAFYKNQSFVNFPLNTVEYFEILASFLAGEFLNIPEINRVLRYAYFIYFIRVKRLKGIDMNHSNHTNRFDFTTADELIELNHELLMEFKSEVIG